MTGFASNHICGLYYTAGTNFQRVYLPQVQLKSKTTIGPVCFTTSLTQTFQNSSTEGLPQLRYAFPLYDGVAVCGYIITYGHHELRGIVQQKDDAKRTYQAAVDRGETAGLLEALPAGIFGVTLGNVPSKTDVVVEITYCGELKHDAAIDGLRYILPTSIAPRYGEYPGMPFDTNAISKRGMSITVDVDMAGSAIRKVQSPSHPISISMGALSSTEGATTAFTPSQASATLALGSAELAQDFVLQLLVDDINKPRALIETHPTVAGQRAIMATLVPNFSLQPILPEIVFVADQSGSMSGSKNDALKAALLVFLKSLPVGVRFNICAFGNHHQLLWPKSQAYNEDNLNTAVSFVDSFKASYGGTEILEPITATFKNRWADLPLEVMVLTDGEVWAQDLLFDYINRQIRDEKVDARVFTLGIGSDVSHTLVEGIARAGNGFAQFVTQNEEIDQKVIRMLKCALFAHTKNYEVDVQYGEKEVHYRHHESTIENMVDDFEIVEKVNDCLTIDDRGKEPLTTASHEKTKSFFDGSVNVDKPITHGDKANKYAHLPILDTPRIVQAPHMIPPLFPFNRTTLYLLLGPNSAQKDVTSLTLRAESLDGPLELTVPVSESSLAEASTLHQLAARKMIQDLEEGRGWIQAAKAEDGQSIRKKYQSRVDEIIERECVTLGERFQVASKWTSFVAVDDTGKSETSQETGEQLGKEQPEYLKRASPSAAFSARARYVDPAFGTSHRGGHTGGLFGRSSSTCSSVPPGGSSLFSMPNSAQGSGGALFGSSASAFGSTSPLSTAQIAQSPGGALFGSSSSLFGIASDEVSAKAQRLTSDSFAAPSSPQRAPVASFQAFGHASTAPHDPAIQAAVAVNNSYSFRRAPRKRMASIAARRAPVASVDVDEDLDVDEDIVMQSGCDSFTSKMHALIKLQTFSGAWSWNEELLATLGLSERSVNTRDFSGNPNACATALAIAFLETKLSSQKDVWDMVVGKARQWLAKEVGKDVDVMVGKASALF